MHCNDNDWNLIEVALKKPISPFPHYKVIEIEKFVDVLYLRKLSTFHIY